MTKLILVEGIPGSGKTSAAQHIAARLADSGIETALYLEGDWSHPADFESVACLDADQFRHLKNRFPQQNGLLDSQVRVQAGDYFFSYRRLAQENQGVPPTLIDALAAYEIYELPVEKFRCLLLQNWREFTRRAAQGDQVFIFECCFLQNPLTFYLGRNAETISDAQKFVLELANSIQPLSPRLIYLHPGEVAATLRRVASERPPEWLDMVIHYHTQQGHGLARGWQGFDGTVEFYRMRQNIEVDLLAKLPFPTLLVKHTTWEQDNAQVEQFIEDI